MANFAPEGNIVGEVPAGSGLMVLANDSIEVFGNEFTDNDSANIMIISYYTTERPFEDPNYDPFPESIYIHDNNFSGGGTALEFDGGALVWPLSLWVGDASRDWDGNEGVQDFVEVLSIIKALFVQTDIPYIQMEKTKKNHEIIIFH